MLELLQNALSTHKLAKSNYDKMAYTYHKEYALYISDAKRDDT
ncbi:YdeI/OmpD-associated family protein [Lutibacter sp.]